LGGVRGSGEVPNSLGAKRFAEQLLKNSPPLLETTEMSLCPVAVSTCAKNLEKRAKVLDLFFIGKMNCYLE
jgi:hypothetical protein